MASQEQRETLIKHMKQISDISKFFIPELEQPVVSGGSLEEGLQLLKKEILKGRPRVSQHQQSLAKGCITVLYQLTSTILDDLLLCKGWAVYYVAVVGGYEDLC